MSRLLPLICLFLAAQLWHSVVCENSDAPLTGSIFSYHADIGHEEAGTMIKRQYEEQPLGNSNEKDNDEVHEDSQLETGASKTSSQAPTTVLVKKENVHVGDLATLTTNFDYENFKKCIAIHNNVTYEIYPNMNLTNAAYNRYTNPCSFTISATEWSHVGRWMIKGYLEETTSESSGKPTGSVVEQSIIYDVYVYETINAQPDQTLTMNSGSASFYIPKTFDNPTSCVVEWNRTTSWELINNDIDPEEGIELYKTCGVRMRVDQSRAGSWILRQWRGNYMQINAKFTIKWVDNDVDVPVRHHLFWDRGSNPEIDLSKYKSAYCDLVRPDGVVILLTEKSCKFRQEDVSDAHAGLWKARLSLPSSMKLVEKEYVVEVWNPNAVEVSVTTEGERINMLCRTGLPSLSSCAFHMPNGTILIVHAAMGDGNYEYYGTGFAPTKTQRKAECGLTIRRPSEGDYGLWKCSMTNNAEIRHSLVNVPNSTKGNVKDTTVFAPTVYAKRGDNFTIKCTIDAPLNYCWLQSPNGSVYSVTKSGTGENSLRYNGEGLSMGVCGAVVENADDTDNGDWSCRLGVVAAAEVESIVPVTVTESELIPLPKKVVVEPGKSTTLRCRTLPTTDATIDYCRWVGPSGHGINRDTLSRYTPSNDENTCQLKLNAVTSVDIGTWICYARLTKASDEEVWSKLQVETVQLKLTNTALNAVAITLLLTTIVAACFLGMTFYRRKVNGKVVLSPPYDAGYYVKKIPDAKVNQYAKF